MSETTTFLCRKCGQPIEGAVLLGICTECVYGPPPRYTPRSTALRCGACGAPLDGAHRCDHCHVDICPDCGCCECICFEVER